MHAIAYNQILILVLQCIIVGSLLLTLFKLRSIFGFSLLFITLGLFQFMQVFLYNTLYFEITPSVLISPGTILFTGSLFSILLIYIRENAFEARKVIYAIVVANLVLLLLQYIISLKIEGEGILNVYNFPKKLFIQQSKITLVGTIALLIDVFVIIFIYEIIAKNISSLFLRFFFTMAIVLSIDSLLFNFGVNYGTDHFLNNLNSHLIAKISSAFIYTALFTFYLIYVDKKTNLQKPKKRTFKDLFSTLTYRQKFEQVTKEKSQISQELIESKNYHQTIFDGTSDAIFIHDAKTGEILDVNKAMCNQFGYTKEEVMQNDMQTLSSDVYPYTKEEANKWMQKVKKEGTQTFEWQARHKNGHVFWVEVSIQLVKINGKERLIASSRNIDDKKIAKVKIKTANKFIFNTLENMTDGYVSLNTNWEYTNVNEKAGKMFGRNPKDLIGKNIWKEFPEAINQPFYKNYYKAVKTQNEIIFEDYYTPWNKWYENRIIPSKNGLAIFFQDITERKIAEESLKKSETKYREIIELAVDGILQGSPKGIITNANTSALNITEKTYDELVGKHISSLFSKVEANAKPLRFDLLLKGETIIAQRKLLRSDGKAVFIEMHSKMMPDGTYQSIIRDVTERKKAAEKIIKSELKLKEAQKIAHLGHWHLNLISNKLKWSDEVYRIFNLKPQEFKATYETFLENIHPDDRVKVNTAYLNSLKTKTTYKIEHRLLLKSGQIKYVIERGKTVFDKNGVPQNSTGTVYDITEQKLAEIALYEREQQMSSIHNTVEDIIFYLKVEKKNKYRFVSVNKAFVKTTGVSKKNVEGKYVNNIIPESSLTLVLKKYQEAINKNKVVSWEETTKYPTGTKTGQVTISPIYNNNGVCTHLVGSVHDITDIRLAEKALKNYANRLELLHNLDKSILIAKSPKNIAANVFKELKQLIPFKLASFGLYDATNNSFNRIELISDFKIKIKANSNTSKNNYDLVDLPLLKTGNVQLINNLKTSKTSSYIFKDLINNNVNAVIIAPLMIENKLTGMLNISTDKASYFTKENVQIIKEIASQLAISVQQWKLKEEIIAYTNELESKVEERTKELEHSNRELRDFAQIVSHDLKAPLRAISQLSYWLSQDYADKIDEDGQKQLNLLIGRVQRLDNLIEGILQFSRIGKTQEKEVIINLNNLVKDTIELMNPPEYIQIKIDTILPVITADPTRITQLFQNLIQNAIKFMDKPKGFINIGINERDNFYEFYVKDNGCGIDNQYFDRIFKIFQRLVSRDEQEGTGIGLSLVKRIAQIYGGDVRLTSKVGVGSTFYVTIKKIIKNE